MIRQMPVIGPDELKKNAKLDLLSAMKPNHFRVWAKGFKSVTWLARKKLYSQFK